MKIKIRYIILALMLAASSFMLGSPRDPMPPEPPQTLPETEAVRAYESPTFDHMGGDAEIPQEGQQ